MQSRRTFSPGGGGIKKKMGIGKKKKI
jgi:hypothetical protein